VGAGIGPTDLPHSHCPSCAGRVCWSPCAALGFGGWAATPTNGVRTPTSTRRAAGRGPPQLWTVAPHPADAPPAISNVVGDGAREQHGLLAHHGHRPRPLAAREFAGGDVGQGDGPLLQCAAEQGRSGGGAARVMDPSCMQCRAEQVWGAGACASQGRRACRRQGMTRPLHRGSRESQRPGGGGGAHLGLIEARQQGRHGGLARPAAPDHGGDGAVAQREVHAAQDCGRTPGAGVRAGWVAGWLAGWRGGQLDTRRAWGGGAGCNGRTLLQHSAPPLLPPSQ
jgi:hypothetical protein